MGSARLPHVALFAPVFSGKTTAAMHLMQEYGYTRFAFADEVKHLGLRMLNAVADDFDRNPFTFVEIEQNKSVFRPFLQWLGTDLVREYLMTPTFWIDQLKKRVATHDGPIVVDDLRFPNEAEALLALGFDFVYIEASENFRFDNFLAATTVPVTDVRAKWEAAITHPSEQQYDTIKSIAYCADRLTLVENTHDFERFFWQLDTFIANRTHE